MKTNKKIREMLSAYVDGELSQNEEKEIEAKIQASPRLQQKLNEFKQLKNLVSSTRKLQPTPGFEDVLMEKINDQKSSSPKYKTANYWRTAGVAATITGLLFIFYFNNKNDNNLDQSYHSEASILSGLTSVLAQTSISKEDVFNFALYKQFPIDKEKKKVLELGNNPEGGEYIKIKDVADGHARPLQDNLSHFKQALRINKKQEKKLDHMLKRYAKELKKHALLSKGNIMALNADLWNFNKALVADVLSFAEDANAKAFFQVMPANYDPDYYSSIKSFGHRSHPTLADTFIIVTAGKHFTKPFIVEVGKVHQNNDIQKYFDNATKHLKCFTYAYAFDFDSVKKLAQKHILKFKFDSDDDLVFDFDDALDFYFRGFDESFSYFWNDSAFSKQFKIDYPQKAYLGVFIKNLDEELAKELGLKNTEGVYIDGLMSPLTGDHPKGWEDGAANQAGIREGDVITKVDEQKVKSTAALRYEISKHRPKEKVSITLYRKGKKKEISVILKSRFPNYLLSNKLLIRPNSLAKSRYWNWQSAPDKKTNQQLNKLRQENQQLKNDMDALKKQMEELKESIKRK